MKISSEESKEFYNNWVQYLALPTGRHQTIFQSLVALVRNLHVETALDLGCGTGITTEFLAKHGVQTVGVDFAENLIGYAKANRAHPHTEYIVGDVTEFYIKREFDLICLIDIFEHVEPTKVMDLILTVNNHAHDATVVYLHLPDHRFQRYMRDKAQQQPIDEEWPLDEVLGLFRSVFFEPAYISFRGNLLAPEYVEIVFVYKSLLLSAYDNIYAHLKKK